MSQSEVGRLESVLLRHPRAAFGSAEAVARQWRPLGYPAPPDFGRAVGEYEAFAGHLRDAGVTIHTLDDAEGGGLDSIYTRDASLICDAGAILCRMGKPARRGEPAAHGEVYGALSVPVVGAIEAPGTLEGGDVVWLDSGTLAVGHGYRTNAAGIAQLRALLGPAVEVVEVQLPHWRGPDDVFHLMSLLSPLDRDLALVYSPLMPVPLRRLLLDRGFELIEVAAEELDTLGCNCLAIGPRRSMLPAGNPRTRRRLEKAGVEVITFEASEICLKGAGGPTCLTRPLARGG